MGKTIYGKLVRDKIPDIIVKNGDTPTVDILSEASYKTALQEKLQEETEELLAANQEERLGEMADILEVLLAIAAADGYSAESLMEVAEQKRLSRGGFEKRIWLESTESS